MLRITGFRRLWYCTGLSSLGDWLGLLATTALATQLATGYQAQNYALGGVLVVRLLPGHLWGRWPARSPTGSTGAAPWSSPTCCGSCCSWRSRSLSTLPVLYVATFLIECVGLFWNPAKDASVPNLVRRDQLEAANQLSLITTYGLTPVLAAALFSVLALISVAGIQLLRHPPGGPRAVLQRRHLRRRCGHGAVHPRRSPGRAAQPRRESQPSLWAMLAEGAQFVRTTGLLRGLILGILGGFAAGGAVIGAGKTYVRSLGGGDAAYGVLFGTVFVGIGLGMALGPRVAREMSRRRVFGLAIVLAGSCLALMRGDAARGAGDDRWSSASASGPASAYLAGTDAARLRDRRRHARPGLRLHPVAWCGW